jgi:PII-like signaling protein
VRREGEFPLGTFVINSVGSFALGLLTGASVTGASLFIAGSGLLGSFTTFSTWMFETERLAEDGEGAVALANLGLSVLTGLRRGSGLGDRRSPVTDDCLKLTIYFGESDRVGRELLSDALLRAFEETGVQAGVLLRATEGFGIKHQLHTQRLLTLSEDLPLVAVAVDRRSEIEALLPKVQPLVDGGLITLERARIVTGEVTGTELPEEHHEATKLTIYLGRADRAYGRPAYVAAVELLRLHGLDGATVLLGVDGMVHSARRRARFFSRNTSVPLMIIASGSGETVQRVLPPLGQLLSNPLLTLERITVCKRDGIRLAEPRHLPETDDAGLRVWQKLLVHAAEDARHERHALYLQLIRRLRVEGATGATALRGIWGYSGDREPHGDRFFSLRRAVPVVTVVIDQPDAIQRWWRVIDEVTDEAGLVTSELVPAFHAVGNERRNGGLRLARLRF